MRQKIPINKSQIPYRFRIKIFGGTYRFEVHYNDVSDTFTLALLSDEKPVCIEPIIYGVPLFKCGYVQGVFPPFDIVALDESGSANKVTYENFGKTVFLTIDSGGEIVDE
jgi:hypothetical protein